MILSWQIIVIYFATNDIFCTFVAKYKLHHMRENIIGRETEKLLLESIYQSNKSEFVAVCGRRRVGKTYLVKEFFEDELVFQTAGLANEDTKRQLKSFYNDLREQGIEDEGQPKDWIEAFALLRLLIKKSTKERKVILLDELPWMDTPRSGFVSALEHFWNVWASSRHDIVLIVCGSATSWMMDKLINSHGGLHNRLTSRIFLQPFTLAESEKFLEYKGFMLSRYDIALCYMVLGGIPYYLDLLQPRMSLAQNIDFLLFRRGGALYHEFSNLYAALFKNADDYITVVKALFKKKSGLSRNEIIEATGLRSGNGLTTVLKNLETCGFIRCYNNFKAPRSQANLYQLIDFFTLFHFHFLEAENGITWLTLQKQPRYYTWAGLTFELLALSHIGQIKGKLGISGIQTVEYAWRFQSSKGGSQIDLIIDRADQSMNLCEMKFSIRPFTIDNVYEMNLRNKIGQLMEYTGKKRSIILTFITTYGIARNKHAGIVSSEVTLDDLFQ